MRLTRGAQVLACARDAHIEARAAPAGLERFSVLVLVEPVLVLEEEGVVGGPGEGHEPDAGVEAERADRVGRRLHAVRVRPARAGVHELALGPVLARARLPAVVDLDEVEAEGLQFLRGEGGELGEVLRIARAGMLVGVPGAVARGLGREPDPVDLRDRAGPGLQAEARVVEAADRQRLRLRVRARLHAQPPVVDLALQAQLPVGDGGEDHAAAAVLREPAGDDAGARRGVGHGEPGVTARVLLDVLQPAGADRLELRRGPAEVEREGEQRDRHVHLVGRAAVVQPGAEEREGHPREEHRAHAAPVAGGQFERLPVAEGGVLHDDDPRLAARVAADAVGGECAPALRVGEREAAAVAGNRERLVVNGERRPVRRERGEGGQERGGQLLHVSPFVRMRRIIEPNEAQRQRGGMGVMGGMGGGDKEGRIMGQNDSDGRARCPSAPRCVEEYVSSSSQPRRVPLRPGRRSTRCEGGSEPARGEPLSGADKAAPSSTATGIEPEH